MPDPREIRSGESVSKNWREINALTQKLAEMSRQFSRVKDVVAKLETERGIWNKAGGGRVQRFKVLSVFDDYLSCVRQFPDGTVDSIVVYVAKPLTLRVSFWLNQTFDGWTYTGAAAARVATYAGEAVTSGLQPGDYINEILSPTYAGSSELIGAQVEGETGVVIGATRVDWIDLNADHRRFVAQRDLVEVCKDINGVPTQRRMVLEGGPVFGS